MTVKPGLPSQRDEDIRGLGQLDSLADMRSPSTARYRSYRRKLIGMG
jgi:hypothetical protein